MSFFKRKSIQEKYLEFREQSVEPWASFEVVGFGENGQIKVEFAWNDSFITKLRGMGYDAETEDEIVQLFFYMSQMRPVSLGESHMVDPTTEDDLVRDKTGAVSVIR